MARNFVSFRVGALWYGLDVDNVMEILHMVLLSDPPAASPDILGLITVRNVVMPVIDLRLRFGVPDAAIGLDTPIITVRTAQTPVGIVVDDIDNVERIAEEQITRNIGGSFPFISGTAQSGERLLLLLNTTALVDPIESGEVGT